MHRASESRDMNNSGGRVRYIPWKTLKVTDSQIIDQIISNSACAVFCEHWHTRHNLWWLGRAQILLRPCRFIITILCMLFMSIVIHTYHIQICAQANLQFDTFSNNTEWFCIYYIPSTMNVPFLHNNESTLPTLSVFSSSPNAFSSNMNMLFFYGTISTHHVCWCHLQY